MIENLQNIELWKSFGVGMIFILAIVLFAIVLHIKYGKNNTYCKYNSSERKLDRNIRLFGIIFLIFIIITAFLFTFII